MPIAGSRADAARERSVTVSAFVSFSPAHCRSRSQGLAYAKETAAWVAALKPKRVLETACGTGFVTRAMVARLSPQTEIIATDLNQPMLDFAAQQEDTREVVWRQADAQHLPFDDASFDIVVCQFGVMFFPDRVAGYREARRVLRPGGNFVFSVWDRLEDNEFSLLIHHAVAALFPHDPPSFIARTPFGYHDVSTIATAPESHYKAAGSSRRTARSLCAMPPRRPRPPL
jgi:ubiquinone/menaquinone biosynthesis C-methylase UbiE